MPAMTADAFQRGAAVAAPGETRRLRSLAPYSARARQRCVAVPAHARLIRLHRHSLFHLLLVGGTRGERERLALAFHRGSPLRLGPFVRLDAGPDEDRLRCALECALSTVTCERLDNPLRESEGGTLFLDRVAHLSLATQRLLLRLLASPPAAASGPCFSRLAVGSDALLEEAAAAGRFHPALFDILDKIRVELRTGTAAGAR
jgi:DNA-binding NtrC family response regulator